MPTNDSIDAADWMTSLLKRIARGGANGIDQLVQTRRSQAEHRAAKRELNQFWVRLGKTAYHLSEAGELDHPAITKAAERIQEYQNTLANN